MCQMKVCLTTAQIYFNGVTWHVSVDNLVQQERGTAAAVVLWDIQTAEHRW